MTSTRTSVLAVAIAVLALAGCSASPEPSPTPTPAAEEFVEPTPPNGEWDLVVEREFLEGGEVRTCTISMAIGDDAEGTPEAIEAARVFLQNGDWTAVEVSLDDFEADDLEARRGQGLGDAALQLMLVGDQITSDLSAAGHLESGMSVDSWSRCD